MGKNHGSNTGNSVPELKSDIDALKITSQRNKTSHLVKVKKVVK